MLLISFFLFLVYLVSTIDRLLSCFRNKPYTIYIHSSINPIFLAQTLYPSSRYIPLICCFLCLPVDVCYLHILIYFDCPQNPSYILLPKGSQQCVADVFNFLTEILGLNIFRKTFPVILTDNGPEFKNPESIEKTPDGKQRTYVFYCDPYVSNQKARIEKNHEFIRYVIPKGKSFRHLEQNDITKLANHINSTARDNLNGATPFDLASLLLNKKVLTSLGLEKVSPDEVLLKPALFK